MKNIVHAAFTSRQVSLLLVLGGSVGVHAATATIELSSQVQVRDSEVRLSDIAHVHSSDKALAQRLLLLRLGVAPKAGQPVTLERSELADWLLRQADVRPNQIVWRGSEQTQITTAHSQLLSSQAVTQVAKAALLKNIYTQGVRVELMPLEREKQWQMPLGDLQLKPRSLADTRLQSRMLVWVDVYADAHWVRSLPVKLQVKAYGPAWVATQASAAGSVFDASTVKSQEVELTALAVPVWQGEATAQRSQRLRRPLRSGEVLTVQHLEAMPSVVRGQQAQLQSRSGGIVLERAVEVLQDGHLGQVVRVKPPQTQGSLMARVTGPGRLEIQQ